MTSLEMAVDPVLADAVELARAAVLEVAPSEQVGDHLGVVADGEAVDTANHLFACTSRAYVGWHWSATVVSVPGSGVATVCDVVLLPGDGALTVPGWVPWSERVRPGDLGPGDLHPTSPDDPRLEPGYTGGDALEEVDDPSSPYAVLRPEQWQIGLGRERVLSVLGRDLAVERWHEERGPASAMAKAAPASCTSCGFLLPIGGIVGQAFGVCTQPLGADGMVVALDFGCGAHSSVREIEGTGIPVTDVVVDEYGYVEVHARAAEEADVLVTSQVVIAEDAEDFEGAANASQSDAVDGDAQQDADGDEGDDVTGQIDARDTDGPGARFEGVDDIETDVDDEEPELDEGGSFATGVDDEILDINPDDD